MTFRSPATRTLALRFALVLLGLRPGIMRAQVVTGAVLDSATGRPVAEFTIHLLNASGTAVASALSRPDGHFALRAPAPGDFALLVMRIGFRRTRSASFTLHAGEVLERQLSVAQIPASLAAVRVGAPQQCDTNEPEGRDVAAVWERVQDAMQAVRLAEAVAPLTMMVRDYARELSLSGRVLLDSSVVRAGRARAAYVSPPPRALADSGYVERDRSSTTYFAPDAATLLDESFVTTHCFRLVGQPDGSASYLGVAFTPVARRRVPDIRGTLWLDRRTAEPRNLEFAYTGLPAVIRDGMFGGQVAFQHVPGGTWIIGSWRVRAPVVRVTSRQVTSGASYGAGGVMRTSTVNDSVLSRIREEGGDVLSARDLRGGLLWASAWSTVRGIVRDSATSAIVPHAELSLRGSPHRALAGDDGAFAIDSVPPGDYTLVARSPSGAVQSSEVHVADRPVEIHVELHVSELAAAALARARADSQARCAVFRAQREDSLRATFAIPANQWRPSGLDSARQRASMRAAESVLQAIADTTGNVDMSTVRAVRRGSAPSYLLALRALAQVTRVPQEPLPGCKLRQLVLLPYVGTPGR